MPVAPNDFGYSIWEMVHFYGADVAGRAGCAGAITLVGGVTLNLETSLCLYSAAAAALTTAGTCILRKAWGHYRNSRPASGHNPAQA